MANIRKRGSSKDAAPEAPFDISKSLQGRYEELASVRQPFLDRAREASKLTIPSLVPPMGTNGTTKLYQPWQSIGSRGVNHLSAKLLLAMLPANEPFFRYQIASETLLKMSVQPELKAKVEEALAKYEKEIMSEIEGGNIRVSIHEALQHLIVAGNVCLFLPPKGGAKLFHLDSYVIVRSPMGDVIELIVEERVSPAQLPGGLKELVKARMQACNHAEKTVRLHTTVRLVDGSFETFQEILGIEVPGSRGTYALDKSPFIPLRWIKIDGQDYGRGHVETLQGDLTSVEGLSQAIVEGSAAAAKILFLVNPNGLTKQKTIAEAPNGAIRTGRRDDVSVLQFEKAADLSVAMNVRQQIQSDLEAAFLMNSSVQRNGERVTAEEIRFMASELEAAYGGVYSLLAQELQLQLVKRLQAQMIAQKRLKPLPKGFAKPAIVTGLEALSRSSDLQRLDVFLKNIQGLGPDIVPRFVNMSDYLTRLATALGIEQKGLIKSAEEVAQADAAAQQQQMQAQMIQGATPNATKALGDIAKHNLGVTSGGDKGAAA